MVTGSTLIAYEISCIKGGLRLMNKEVPPRFMHPKEWQHLTMFILLTLNGCVDVMSKNLLPQRPVTGYPWQDDDISDIMFITTFFCWHVMINALCLVGIYGVSSIWHRWYRPSLKLTRFKENPYCMNTEGPVYKLLPEVEESEKGDQALLFSESSLSDRA
ncbi:Transmembrane epididymal protein 1 [Pteropus alecto]|uniref:Transmembrane epididymal protein 1 n=1 Tax=Pteropus alecto TaxID=9402 RepID=L5KZG4_PTEAL|nr:Transmembrane epididymal protein 1 [Pteropus alecto]